MKDFNIYDYAVYRNKALKMPLHIVTIRSELVTETAFFSNSKDAKNHINETKESLSVYGINLEFADISVNKNILKAYTNAKRLYSDIRNKQLYLAF